MLVEVADHRGFEFAHTRAALVDHEERDDALARDDLGDPLDVLGERRRDMGLAFSR